MNEAWLSRTSTLLGECAVQKLEHFTVAIIGLGGVGGAAAEAVCRMGVGTLILVDNDVFDITNLNRQILSSYKDVGREKSAVACERFSGINPNVKLVPFQEFYLPGHSDFLFDQNPDLVLDAIDTVSAKLDLAVQCANRNIPLVSCLGTGNRLDPSLLRWGDISETAGTGCPLARVIRREMKKLNLTKQSVVYSTEPPVKGICTNNDENGRHSPASCSFVPPSAGYLLASVGIRMLLNL